MSHDHHHNNHDHGHDQHNWWLGGGTTALIALIPLFIIAFLLYSGWTRLKQVSMAMIMAMALILAIEMVTKVNLWQRLVEVQTGDNGNDNNYGKSQLKRAIIRAMAITMAIIMETAVKMAKANSSCNSCFQRLSRDGDYYG